MTNDPLIQAARRLAEQLRLSPSIGSVWAWREGGSNEILVQLQRPIHLHIPKEFQGFHVVIRHDVTPQVHGVQVDRFS